MGKISIAVDDASLRTRIVSALSDSAEIEFVSPPNEPDAAIPADVSDAELSRTVALLTKLAAARAELRRADDGARRWARLAETDPLTELPNRRAWDEALAAALPDVPGHERPLCLAIVDLDEFKGVNDAHGHTTGDKVLQAIAAGLRSAVRRGDVAARLGGDEFGLLLPDLAPDRAVAVLRRIRQATTARLAELRLPPVTCSIGFAAQSSRRRNPAQLLAAADDALHAAKRAGRDRIEAAADPS